MALRLEKEKDVESFLPEEKHLAEYPDESIPEDPLPSSLHDPPSRPLLVRYLPSDYQLRLLELQSRFYYYYWHYPIELPASIESRRKGLEHWWNHPLPSWTPKIYERAFQKWWLASEAVWKKRRWIIVMSICLCYIIIGFNLGLSEAIPYETRRDFNKKLEAKVGPDGCSGIFCLKPMFDVMVEMATAPDKV